MHICCANCSLYPIQTILERGIKVHGLWFNPNIHPFTEYQARLGAVKELENRWGLDIDYKDYYGLKEFIRGVVNNEDDRCAYCYSIRLEETARRAKESGMDGFTSSLLVSPYQKFEMINEVGVSLQERYNVEFFTEDFRTGWRDGVKISRSLGFYRQKYCGCIYSEMERYLGKNEGRLTVDEG